MKKISSNPCIRCGTERIIVKTWNEKAGNSIIVNTQTACPDSACQRKVNGDNKKMRDKTAAHKLESEQRAISRKAVKDAERTAKAAATS